MADHRHPPLRLPQTVVDILESMTDAFVALDRDWHYIYVNRRAGELFGRAPEDLVGRHIWTEFPDGVGQPFHLAYERAMREQRLEVLEDFYPPFGRWFENRICPSPEGLTIFFQDITDRKLAEQELARREARYRVLAHAFSSVVWEAGPDGAPVGSASWAALTGRGDTGADPSWADAVHPDDQARVAQAWSAAVAEAHEYDAVYRLRAADGAWRTVRARGVPVVEDELVHWIGVLDDITDQVRAEETLRRAALEDPLTGLGNRALFVDRLAAVLGRRERRTAAVLFADVDRFKAVNDTQGHAGGDRVLQAVAGLLDAGVRPSDLVGRLSGDEFAVLCDDLTDMEEAVAVAHRLRRAVAGAGQVTIAVGVAELAADDREPEAVLRAADAAMYEVKVRGGDGVEVFDATLRARLRRREEVEEDLRRGLDGGAVGLAFQPIVSVGWPFTPTAEALLRLQGRDGRPLPAPEVIAVAERTGLVVALGARVLRQACAEAAAWHAAGTSLAVSVNVSPRQFARPDELVEHVAEALTASGLAPGRLRLELTESVLMEDLARSRAVLGELRQRGVVVVVDDFGVGHSSLAYLHELPFDAVKVDRSFVLRLPGDTGSARIVEAVVGVARAFGARVIAEGVETRDQLAAVIAAGVDGVQGFGLARPVGAAELPGAMAQALERATRG